MDIAAWGNFNVSSVRYRKPVRLSECDAIGDPESVIISITICDGLCDAVSN